MLTVADQPREDSQLRLLYLNLYYVDLAIVLPEKI